MYYLCTRKQATKHTLNYFIGVIKVLRRDGRVVDYSSLENYRTERYRGFESLSLRQSQRNELYNNKLR